MLKPIGTADTAAERFSFLVQEGVEIFEHELIRSLRPEGSGATFQPRATATRLIVEETGENEPNLLFAKKPSDICELIQFLKTAVVSS